MKTINAAGRELSLYGEGGPLILLLGGGEAGDAIWSETKKRTAAPLTLALLPVEDWDGALSPWPAEKIFRGGRDFSGGAGETLSFLERELLPALTESLGRAGEAPWLAGYSLAGLFALWALFESDSFAGALSASGSLWYPGFADYAARPFRPRAFTSPWEIRKAAPATPLWQEWRKTPGPSSPAVSPRASPPAST